MKEHVFVGFGFGPIQSGLFAAEAFRSKNFKRIVIAEVDQNLVDAIRDNSGTYHVNVATSDSVITEQIDGIEIFNPTNQEDKAQLLSALKDATEIVTSLPSVNFYDLGETSVAKLIAAGIKDSTVDGKIAYAAENNNHGAELLEEAVGKYVDIPKSKVQFLNTVIGKMSQVTTDETIIKEKSLKTITPSFMKAFLVEEFNKILVTKVEIPGFVPGIEVFAQKSDLLPFEEAKLFGHNAIHAMLSYLGAQKGYENMDQLRGDKELMGIARDAFINVSGAGLIHKYASLGDELFTQEGFAAYADDLLDRMTNPFLTDAVARAARDPKRKLSARDRIFGSMKLALEAGVEPTDMARGAKDGLKYLLKNADENEVAQELRFNPEELDKEKITKLLEWLWQGEDSELVEKFAQLLADA